jgi:hypothetical protein
MEIGLSLNKLLDVATYKFPSLEAKHFTPLRGIVWQVWTSIKLEAFIWILWWSVKNVWRVSSNHKVDMFYLCTNMLSAPIPTTFMWLWTVIWNILSGQEIGGRSEVPSFVTNTPSPPGPRTRNSSCKCKTLTLDAIFRTIVHVIPLPVNPARVCILINYHAAHFLDMGNSGFISRIKAAKLYWLGVLD